MKFFKFLAIKKWEAFFSSGNWVAIGAHTVLFLIMVFYAVGVARLYDAASESKTHFHPSGIFISLCILFSVLPLMTKFFPTLTRKRTLFPAQFPLTKKQIIFTDLILLCFFRTMNICLFLFLFIFTILSRHAGAFTIFHLVLFLVAGFFLAENIINAISWPEKKYIPFLVCGIFLQTGALYDIIYRDGYYATIILGFQIAFLIAVYYQFYQVRSVERAVRIRKQNDSKAFSGNPYFGFLYKKSSARTSLLLAFGLKTFMMILFTTRDENLNGDFSARRFPALLLFFSQLLLYSYIFNNCWGFFRKLAQNLVLSPAPSKLLSSAYRSMVLPCIILDTILVLGILYGTHHLSVKVIAAYFSSSVMLYFAGAFVSFSRYLEIKSAFRMSFKGNSSQTAIFIELFLILGLALFYTYDFYFYAYCFVLLLIGIQIFLYSNQNRQKLLKRFKLKLFSGNNTV